MAQPVETATNYRHTHKDLGHRPNSSNGRARSHKHTHTHTQTNKHMDATKRIISPASRSIKMHSYMQARSFVFLSSESSVHIFWGEVLHFIEQRENRNVQKSPPWPFPCALVILFSVSWHNISYAMSCICPIFLLISMTVWKQLNFFGCLCPRWPACLLWDMSSYWRNCNILCGSH